jgi:hypothetical protein
MSVGVRRYHRHPCVRWYGEWYTKEATLAASEVRPMYEGETVEGYSHSMTRAAQAWAHSKVAYISVPSLDAHRMMASASSSEVVVIQQSLQPRSARAKAAVTRLAPVQHIWLFATKYKKAPNFAVSPG